MTNAVEVEANRQEQLSNQLHLDKDERSPPW